jgi:hypothetical protein
MTAEVFYGREILRRAGVYLLWGMMRIAQTPHGTGHTTPHTRAQAEARTLDTRQPETTNMCVRAAKIHDGGLSLASLGSCTCTNLAVSQRSENSSRRRPAGSKAGAGALTM